jgi:hypothetical protein
MKLSQLLRIINEEISNYTGYTPDWMSTDPSVADKYYEKIITTPNIPPAADNEIDAEKIGYITKRWDSQLDTPVPIFKNPKNLRGFEPYARGVLLNNGDFYLAKSDNAVHMNFLDFLSEKGILSADAVFQYYRNYPKEFIAVQRASSENKFTPSTAYDEFPDYYVQMFEMATRKHPFDFKTFGVHEQLDPNWLMSYTPQGYDPGIVYETKRK